MYDGEIWHADTCRVFVTYGLGLMSIGVIVGKKIAILKHCVECVCTLLRWIYIDCSDGRTPASSSKAATPRWLTRDPDRDAQRRDVIVSQAVVAEGRSILSAIARRMKVYTQCHTHMHTE